MIIFDLHHLPAYNNGISERSSSFLSSDFCILLENAICEAFANSGDKKLRSFWCDGVNHSPFFNDQVNVEYLSFENIGKTGIIETNAWIGADGQSHYQVTIVLGKKALQKYAKGEELQDCIHVDRLIDWSAFSEENKTIKIELD